MPDQIIREEVKKNLHYILRDKVDGKTYNAIYDRVLGVIDQYTAEREKNSRISELDWVLGRLSKQGYETDTQILNRVIDEVDDNLAALANTKKEEV